MAFQIKNFVSIVSSMVNHMRGSSGNLTDFNVGSVNRTLIEAPAIEIEELYIQMLNGLIESVPVAVYQAFDFTRRAAIYAVGTVTFSASPAPAQDIAIPLGTVLTVPGTAKTYATTAAATLLAGQTSVTVPVQATTAGIAGNTLSATITSLQASISGITGVTNAAAYTNGIDEETDEERKTRFGAYISTLSRGTLGAIEYAASIAVVKDVNGALIEVVDRVGIVEEVPGRVSCYIFNGSGSTADALVIAAQQIIDGYIDAGTGEKVPGYRAGGTEVTVRKMTEQPVALTATVATEAGYTLNATMRAALEAAHNDYVLSIGAGETLYLSELYARLTAVEGVAGLTITAPAGDITPAANIALVLGTITLA